MTRMFQSPLRTPYPHQTTVPKTWISHHNLVLWSWHSKDKDTMDSEVFPLNSGKVQAQKDPTEEVEAAHFVQIYYLKKYFHFLSQL